MEEKLRIIVLDDGVIHNICETIQPIGFRKNGDLDTPTQNFIKASIDILRECRGKRQVVIELVQEKKEGQ